MEKAGTPATRVRDVTFDILKGIGIAEVLTHHTFSFSARKFAENQSVEWWGLMLTNRILHFAIPTFLLVAALLLARSLSRTEKPNIARYLDRRVVRTLKPYLIWSFLYLFARAYFVRVGSDVHPYTLQLPGSWAITGPNVFVDPVEVKYYLLWGKAYYHLYFLSVLIQLSLALPILVWLMKRFRPTFGAVLLLSGALQFGAYLMQANFWRSPHPASTLAWYLPSVMIGTWLGMNWKKWPAIWASGKKWFVALAVLSGVPYLVLSALEFKGITVSNLGHNASLVVYGASMALILLGVAGSLNVSKKSVAILAYLGTYSLPLFVIHPAVLHMMGGPRITAVLDAIPFSPFIVLGITLFVTLAIAKLFIWMRLDMLLFGRRYAQEATSVRLESPAAAPAT